MQRIIVAWNKSGELDFESTVPLAFMGERNRELGSLNKCNLVFLSGFDSLSVGYLEKLAALGYDIHDAQKCYSEAEKQYPTLMVLDEYERKCFLRWVVIKELFGAIPFVHYDGDVLFNTSPEDLEASFKGLTFILQGCPAYAHISDTAWLDAYIKELGLYARDIKGYAREAGKHRADYASVCKAKNSNLWEDRAFMSDQDLLRFMTLSGRIIQADAKTMQANCPYVMFQNPLCLSRDVVFPLPLRYCRTNGVDFLNNQRVGIWHLQTSFCKYLGYAALRKSLGFRNYTHTQSKLYPDFFLYKVIRRLTPLYGRLWLCNHYFNKDGHDLEFLLNDRQYHEKGVFMDS